MAEPFRVDQRVGEIAVYRGPRVNCTGELHTQERSDDVAVILRGRRCADPEHPHRIWESDHRLAEAQRIAAGLNQADQKEDGDG